MLFSFHLQPLEKIQPWGKFPNLSLSWFSLTEGFYRLKVGSTNLFSYSEEFCEYCRKTGPQHYPGPYVEYYVVRLWEDILNILPNVLEPLPKELLTCIRTNESAWFDWKNKAIDWTDSQPDENQTMAIFDLVTTWQDNRRLNCAYLTHAPNLWIWSDKNFVFFSWDDAGIQVEGIPVWGAKRGHYAINRDVFLKEARRFHHQLISAMAARVSTVCEGHVYPDVTIDIPHLKHEQADRNTWIRHALRHTPNTDWSKVMKAVSILFL